MKRIIILTGSELRHDFFRRVVAGAHDCMLTYCESVMPLEDSDHLRARAQSEGDFFGLSKLLIDRSWPRHIPRGEINDHAPHIIDKNPDLVICYGASIIDPPLIEAFRGRFINCHLGLSPYLRGAATNFQALVAGQPELVGASFLHMSKGIDEGEIIHQIRPVIYPDDSPHQIGNRLIYGMTMTCCRLIDEWDRLEPMPQLAGPSKTWRIRDAGAEAVELMRSNFAIDMIPRYLADKTERDRAWPIVQQRVLG